MGATPLVTAFRTAALCALLVSCADCRKEEPARQATSRPHAALPATAEGTHGSPRPDPGSAAWWLESPAWYQALSVGERGVVDEADRRLVDASRLLREGELSEARDEVLGAQRAYLEVLGASHWKTWDCQLQAILIEAEGAWDDRERERAIALGLKHLDDDDINETLLRAASTLREQPSEARPRVDAICDLLGACAGPPYISFFEALRDYYYGWAAFRRQEYAAAQERFERTLERLETLIPCAHPLKAHLHNILSHVVTERCARDGVFPFPRDWQDYRRRHLRACLQTLREQVPVDRAHAPAWRGALYDAGQLLRDEQRYGEAKFLFSGAVAIGRRFEPQQVKRLNIYLLDLASACNAVGDGDAARVALAEIERSMPQAASRPGDVTRFLTESGVAHLRLGQYEQACEALRRALDIGSEGPGRDPGRVPYCYGAALTKMGRFAEAIEQYECAIHLTNSSETSALAALFALRAKIFRLAPQGASAALRDLAGQLQNLDRHLGDAGEARRQRLLGYVHLLLDEPEQAMQSLEEAARHYEKARAVGHLVPLDLGPWHENESPYLLGAIGALRLRAWDRAFQWLERHSAQVLDSLTQQAGAPEIGWPDVLRALAADDVAAGPGGSVTTDTSTAAVASPGPCTLSPIGDDLLMDDSVAAVGWVDDIPEPGRPTLPDRWVFALRRSGDQARPAFVQVDKDAMAPEEVIDAISGKAGQGRWQELAYRFYQQRVAPIMPQLAGVHRLYVLNRGLMLGFPADALPLDDPGQHASPELLGDRFATAYGPSCSTLRRLNHDRQRATPAGPGRILAVGDAKTPDWPLPATGVEAECVARYFGRNAKVLLGAGATESALYALSAAGSLRDYSYLHLAVHARADALSPDRCYLELTSPGSPPAQPGTSRAELAGDDGTMSFREVMGLRLGPSLVVLSACETAHGRPLESEGYLGLPHAFFHAGARAMVSTLWPVGDVSTALLMDRFYSNLIERKMCTAESLQDARRHLRNQTWSNVVEWCTQHDAADLAQGYVPSDDLAYDHPRYWASFVLIGPLD
jgi:CHAT domain-containing protein/tetratricopeptide (TPR) repeat protein